MIAENIKAVKLGSKELDPGTNVTPTGWGKTSETGGISPVLMQVTVPTISHDECKEKYDILTTQVCTSGTGGHGTCNVSTRDVFKLYKFKIILFFM